MAQSSDTLGFVVFRVVRNPDVPVRVDIADLVAPAESKDNRWLVAEVLLSAVIEVARSERAAYVIFELLDSALEEHLDQSGWISGRWEAAIFGFHTTDTQEHGLLSDSRNWGIPTFLSDDDAAWL